MNLEAEPGRSVTTGVDVSMTVRRGQNTWNFIYIMLAFALSIEGTVIQMIPDFFPWNILAYVVVGTATAWLFLDNGWFQNKLVGWRSYEDRER